jgi:hypothetical protein
MPSKHHRGHGPAITVPGEVTDLPDHGTSYRTTVRNGVLTYVKDGDKPVRLIEPALSAWESVGPASDEA